MATSGSMMTVIVQRKVSENKQPGLIRIVQTISISNRMDNFVQVAVMMES
jgi:hypothetical protein